MVWFPKTEFQVLSELKLIKNKIICIFIKKISEQFKLNYLVK